MPCVTLLAVSILRPRAPHTDQQTHEEKQRTLDKTKREISECHFPLSILYPNQRHACKNISLKGQIQGMK